MKIIVHKIRFWSILFTLAITLFSSVYGQYPQLPEPWQSAYNISLNDFEFKHPMTCVSAAEIAIIKRRIKHGIEPQNTAFKDLIVQAHLALKFIPDIPDNLNIPGGYMDSEGLDKARSVLWENSHAAYTCALAFSFTDSIKFADKAITILMNWANNGTTFTGDDRGLQIGSYFTPMLYAADLLHGYERWPEADKKKFKKWWRDECLLNGDVLEVMRRKDNNWKDAALLGTLAASVVLEDTAYLRESLIQLKSYFYPRTDDNVRLPGKSWKISNDQKGVYLPREVVRNDGRSGLTYTAYALTTMVQCFEIARYVGHDFWNDTTMHGARIVDVINQYYRWDAGDEIFPWNENAKKSDKRRNHYEIANSRNKLSKEMIDFIHHNRPVEGREGDAYTTLNKGDMNLK